MSEDLQTELETEIEVGDGEEQPEAEEVAEGAEGEQPEAEKDLEPPKPKDKPKKTFEERQAEISRKTWEMREAERKLSETEARANAVLAKLEAKEAAANNPKPVAENFETTEEYIEALTDWKIEKKSAEQAVKKPQQQNPTLTNWGEKREAATKKHTDFADNEIQIERAVRHYENPMLATLIVESEVGTELVQYLGKNTEVLERIAKLSPVSLAKEIGKLEDKITPQKPTFKRQTGAPAPAERVGTGGGTPSKDPNKMSYEEFAKARNEKRI